VRKLVVVLWMLCFAVPVAGWSADSPGAPANAVRRIAWDTLLPAKERESYNPQPPPPIHDYLGEGDPAALQTGSFEANPELNGVRVRIPGFVVPLERAADGRISEFLLVPYFGACIHVPPPPPNQIVYVKMRAGAGLASIEDAQWITGTLHTSVNRSALGAAAYVLDGERLEAYQSPNP
jgi:hypothetical protein